MAGVLKMLPLAQDSGFDMIPRSCDISLIKINYGEDAKGGSVVAMVYDFGSLATNFAWHDVCSSARIGLFAG